MISNYTNSLPHILRFEGGYTNHPDDPGGPTNKGVIQVEYNNNRRLWKLPVQSVRFITDDEVTRIYKTKYWDIVRADELPVGIDFAVFDFAVNSGPVTAVKKAQQVLVNCGYKIDVDGWMGPQTIKAITSVNAQLFIKLYVQSRMNYLKQLGKLWRVFGEGWTARVIGRFEKGKLVELGVLQVAIAMNATNPLGVAVGVNNVAAA
jgi:lysozyme family protein